MTDDGDTDRVEGVNFEELNPILEDLSYPVSSAEFVERYGDRELPRTNADPISVEELFDYMGDATFESEEELRQMIVGQMPRDSEGRTNYSDRGGSLPTQTEEAEEAAEQQADDLQDGVSTDTETKQQE